MARDGHYEKDLYREGGWTRSKRCFDVGLYHIEVRLSSLDPWDYKVTILRLDRVVFEVIVAGPLVAKPPITDDFLRAATTAMDEAERRMLVDQPSLEQEAVFIAPGEHTPGTFYRNAPC